MTERAGDRKYSQEYLVVVVRHLPLDWANKQQSSGTLRSKDKHSARRRGAAPPARTHKKERVDLIYRIVGRLFVPSYHEGKGGFASRHQGT